MDNNTYEQEIDLKDLIFAVLKRWRFIIITAFVLGVLLGGYKCVKEFINHRNAEFVAEAQEEYEKDLERYEQSKKGYERNIENLTASIKYQEAYKENSVLLKIDPYNKGVASADIFVRMPEEPQESGLIVTTVDPADSLVQAYASAVQQGGFLAERAKKKKIDLVYLRELIKVTMDYNSNMFHVDVTYTNEQDAERLLNEIIDNVEDMYPDMQGKLGAHSLEVVNQVTSVVTDQDLSDYQDKKVNELTDANKNLTDTEAALKALAEPELPTALSKKLILKSGIKYGVLGGVFGAFLAAFGMWVIYVMNGKLNSDEDLKQRFGIKLLGSFSEVRRKRAFSGIDNWLARLEGKDNLADDAACDMIAAGIEILADKERPILFTGTVSEGALKGLTAKLQERLPGWKMELAGDINRNPVALRKIPEYSEIILVEARKVSKLGEIEKEIETVFNMKKKFIGYIVLDSKRFL